MVEVTNTELIETVEELREEIHRIAGRLAALEVANELSAKPAGVEKLAAPSETVNKAAEPPISEEIMLVISAAVAAFMGERAHIRQVRLIRSGLWAQQGRVSIQASHYLHHH